MLIIRVRCSRRSFILLISISAIGLIDFIQLFHIVVIRHQVAVLEKRNRPTGISHHDWCWSGRFRSLSSSRDLVSLSLLLVRLVSILVGERLSSISDFVIRNDGLHSLALGSLHRCVHCQRSLALTLGHLLSLLGFAILRCLLSRLLFLHKRPCGS